MAIPELRRSSGNVSEATTWVCKAPDHELPYCGEALNAAVSKGMFIGLHPGSRSVIVHLPEPQQAQRVQRKLQTILGCGASAKVMIERMEALDHFHTEVWGLEKLNRPNIPEVVGNIIEEDDLSDSESEPDVTMDTQDEPFTDETHPSQGPLHQNLFELALPHTQVTHVVPSFLATLNIKSEHERNLFNEFESVGPLTPFLEKALGQRGVAHTLEIQQTVRSSASHYIYPIQWLTDPPSFITVHSKPWMSLKRRVEWILWKANELHMDLTLPTFMAFFKQMSSYNDSAQGRKWRLTQFKNAVEEWRGHRLDWKGLDADERNLIQHINDGNMDCYCSNCNGVLDPRSRDTYCSDFCKSQFCQGCSKKYLVKQVVDHEATNLKKDQMGPWYALNEMASILPFKSALENVTNIHDVNKGFDDIIQRRAERKCCKHINCLPYTLCKQCNVEFKYMTRMQSAFERIRQGDFNWAQCEKASQRLQEILATPNVMKDVKFCDHCSNRRVRQRV